MAAEEAPKPSDPDPGSGTMEEDSPGPRCAKRREVDPLEAVIDGPLAWVVTAATFVIHFILYGFIFVMGLYFVVFLKTFRRSSSETSWIASLYLGTLCSTGKTSCSILPGGKTCMVCTYIYNDAN